MNRTLKWLLFSLYFIFIFGATLGHIHCFDYSVYSNLGYALLKGHVYGQDFIDTKLDSLLWVYAAIMKIFTHGEPYFAAVDFFNITASFFNILLFYTLSRKVFRDHKTIIFFNLCFFITFFYEINAINLNSETIETIFILLAINLLLSKEGRVKNNPFWAGFFIGVAGLLRIVAIFNVFTIIFFCFITYYKSSESFYQNIQQAIKLKWKFYLTLAISTSLPFLLYLIYISYSHNWVGFFNYIKYIFTYSKDSPPFFLGMLKSTLLTSPKLIALHILFILSMVINYSQSRKFFLYSFSYFAINIFFAYFILSHHYTHYYIQIYLVYPFVITQAVVNILKNKTSFLTPFILSFVAIMILWMNIIVLRNYSRYGDFIPFMLKNLSQKELSYQNYLDATDQWICSQKNFCEKANILKQFYSSKNQFNTLLLSDARNHVGASPELLNYLKIINYAYNQDFTPLSFYQNKGFPKRIIISSTHRNIKSFAEDSLIMKKLLTNNWGQNYKKVQKFNFPMPKRKSILYLWVWNLK